jgi:gas vesicle protein
MSVETQEFETHPNQFFSIVAGLFIGGLAGAVTMLLLAPKSGRATRDQIQEKGIELRDQASEMLEDALAQVRMDRKTITLGGRKKAKELLQSGQALVAEQLEQVSAAAQAGKKAVLRA